ncbi:MAG: SMP-30/gluconolactonase/LRE family protein [Thermodesulfobacteriota bacterium]
MSHTEPRLLLDALIFPEGPRWHDGRLWFSDMHAHEVVAVDESGSRETMAVLEHSPSGLGWLPDGRLLVVSMEDRRLLRREDDGRLAVHAELAHLAPFHLNDMVVDHHGNAYVGNFGFDLHGGGKARPTCLILVTPDGRARVVAEDMAFPNGAVVTPDGGTLIVAESFGKRLTAFAVRSDGTLTHRRTWASLDVHPDGIALDEAGCVWVANPMAPGGFVRVAEGGRVEDRIDLAQHAGFACALGGADRKTLFLLEAIDPSPNNDPQRGNGWIRATRVDVAGAGIP